MRLVSREKKVQRVDGDEKNPKERLYISLNGLFELMFLN